MRPYEVMAIFDVGAEPPTIQAVVDRLLETIRGNDGTPGHVDRWGRRPFAYEVKHRREGYYVVVELTGEARTVAEIDRLLSLADEVLRFKVIRIPDKVATRLAGSGGGQTRPGGRGPATRGHGGRGPRSDAPARGPEAARPSTGEDEPSGLAGEGSTAESPAEEGTSPEAAVDAATPSAN